MEGTPRLGSEPLAAHDAADRLTRAFRDGGVRALEPLRGRFSLAIWDNEKQEGVLAVDPLATQPLFFRQQGRHLHFASEMRDLLGILRATPQVSDFSLVRWIAGGVLEPDETLFDGVERLPGGHLLHYRGGAWQRQCYWRPHFREPLAVDRAQAAALVRNAITDAVRQRTGASQGVMLSGGLDSSSVAALARREAPLRAYSAVFPDYASADESELIAAVTQALRIGSRTFPAAAAGVMSASAAYLREWRMPPAAPTLFFQMPLLRAARADGITVLLDGQGGDELFGCAPYLLADAARRLHLPTVRRLARLLPGFGTAPEPKLVRAAYRRYALAPALPAHRRRKRQHDSLLRREYAERAGVPAADPWRDLDGPRWWATATDQLTRGRQRFGAFEHFRRKLASAGLVGAHPFLDDLDLIEFALQLPPELNFDPVFDRPLLRSAVQGLVPEQVRLRVTKSHFDDPIIASLGGTDLPTVVGLLSPRAAQIRRYVAPAALERLLTAGHSERGPAWARRIWRLACVELWLRQLEGVEAVIV